MNTRNFFTGLLAIVALFSFSSCENALIDQQDKNYGWESHILVPECLYSGR